MSKKPLNYYRGTKGFFTGRTVVVLIEAVYVGSVEWNHSPTPTTAKRLVSFNVLDEATAWVMEKTKFDEVFEYLATA